MTSSARSRPHETSDQQSRLDSAQVNQFVQDGYVILPGFLPEDMVARVKAEADTWVDTGLRARSIEATLELDSASAPPAVEIELRTHGELVAYPPLMSVLEQLMGQRFVFHHMHSDRQVPGVVGKPWHHDYEQSPHAGRTHLMVHALHYVDGLDDATASLAVLPGSHREVTTKTARAHLGTDVLEGEVVIDKLPPGSTALLHSALFHTRRPRPSAGRPRYFIDASYCEVGILWPPVKPYWRHVLRRGQELGLADARWPDLFAEQHFSEYAGPV